MYAWDVPEGWWRVKYEKSGYETVWSEWLPVPPPQTNVNIGMVKGAVYFGDVNEDEAIDAKDVTALRRFLAGGWGVEINEANSDVNSDGEINAKDVTVLRRYLAGGWGVVLGEG